MSPERRTAEPRHRRDVWRRRTARRWDVDPHEPVGREDGDASAVLLGAVPGEVEADLVALAEQLAIAGSRARATATRDARARPDPAFGAALRARLVDGLPPVAPVAATAPATSRLTAAPCPPEPRPASALAGRRLGRLPAPRWTALAVVATLVSVAIGIGAGTGTGSTPSQAHLTRASAAAISRGGVRHAVDAGAALLPGDALVVEPGGRATVTIGAVEARLDGGTTLELEALRAGLITVVERAGRAWFRVDDTAAVSLAIRTGGVTWTMRAGALDVSRAPTRAGAGGAGEDEVAVVVVEGSVAVHATGLDASLLEGRRAVTAPAADLPDLTVTSAATDGLTDPWLLENAALDRAQARPLGILADVPGGEGVRIP